MQDKTILLQSSVIVHYTTFISLSSDKCINNISINKRSIKTYDYTYRKKLRQLLMYEKLNDVMHRRLLHENAQNLIERFNHLITFSIK